jgi:hypothetical protein
VRGQVACGVEELTDIGDLALAPDERREGGRNVVRDDHEAAGGTAGA